MDPFLFSLRHVAQALFMHSARRYKPRAGLSCFQASSHSIMSQQSPKSLFIRLRRTVRLSRCQEDPLNRSLNARLLTSAYTPPGSLNRSVSFFFGGTRSRWIAQQRSIRIKVNFRLFHCTRTCTWNKYRFSPSVRASARAFNRHLAHTGSQPPNQRPLHHNGVGLRNSRLCVGFDCHLRRHRRRQERHESTAIPEPGVGRLFDDHLNGEQEHSL